MKPVYLRSNGESDHNKQLKSAIWLLICVVLFIIGMVGAVLVKSWPVKVLFLVIALLSAIYVSRYRPTEQAQKETPVLQVGMKKPIPPTAANLKTEVPEGSSKKTTTMSKDVEEDNVFVSERGTKFHKTIDCAGLKFAEFTEKVPRSKALPEGKTPCKLCHTDKA